MATRTKYVVYQKSTGEIIGMFDGEGELKMFLAEQVRNDDRLRRGGWRMPTCDYGIWNTKYNPIIGF